MDATSSNYSPAALPQPVALSAARTPHQRTISAHPARARTTLGHAIEYLTDQFVHDGESLVANNDRLEAVKLLMTLNRQVFFEYQQLPKWNVRFRSVLGLF